MAQVPSVFKALGVNTAHEALMKIGNLEQLAEVMRKAGLLTSDLIFGIDYTASNKNQGRISFDGKSLHAILPDQSNPYEEVITVLGKTLAPFSTSGHIPTYGFGDSKTTDNSVFRLKEGGFCHSFDEVLEVYNKITPKVYLSGPTNFAPLIYESIELCKNDGNYRILVIVADGQVTSERQTVQAIVDACDYPLSIIVVGVGDGPWQMMHQFDTAIPKRPWDNFHFVEYHKIVEEHAGNSDLAFAIEALWEVPDQYQEIVKLGLVDLSKASAAVEEQEKLERERLELLAKKRKEEQEERDAEVKKISILEVMHVESASEALQKINSLQEISNIMRQAGLKSSNLIFGIDYTASNKYQGKNSFGGKSLHSLHIDHLNPYQLVISILGKTLAPFSTSGTMPTYGFGDAKTSDQAVFPLRKGGVPCKDFDEVLEVYNQITPKVILSGPTNFAPLIYESIEICKREADYHILVVVADGQVTSEKATREAILEACDYPLSIIVVGVGDGPWEMMEVFDDSLPQRTWDNFHFVEYNELVKDKGDKADLAFAVECLLEIPDQYKEICRLGLLKTEVETQAEVSVEAAVIQKARASSLSDVPPPPPEQLEQEAEPEMTSPTSPRKISMFQVLKVGSKREALKQIQTLPEVSDIMRKAGLLSSNLIFGIDYTASNKEQGRKSFGDRSLHYISVEFSNPYQQVIRILGKTLEPFCSSGRFPAYGFGDVRTTDRSIFPLSKGGFCHSFREILTIYNRITPNVVLSGPTNFAPLIDKAIDICKEDGDYHILVIVADGQVTNADDTIRAIVDACKVPLSIIVVGVGDGPWDMMHHFDDSIPTRDWDNFHFVEFQKVARGQRSDLAFALEALLEIPDQYKQIRELGLLTHSRVIKAIEETKVKEAAVPALQEAPAPSEEAKAAVVDGVAEPALSLRKTSVFQVMNVTSKLEVVQQMKTFQDISDIMLKAGLKTSNLIFGIDYTASNKYQGEESFDGKSLHTIDYECQNPYQQVITVMGKTLEPFATTGFIPAYGFGDIRTSDQKVFKLKKEGKSCTSFNEVLDWYNKVTPKVILSGPTNFAPLIYEAIQTCKEVHDYHILVIVADGQVTSVKDTRQAILEACDFPLSIIVVGVGDGPWDMMRVFDASLPHRAWDNFHFVDFYQVTKDAGKNSHIAFAVEALLEVPDQYKQIQKLGLLDKAPTREE